MAATESGRAKAHAVGVDQQGNEQPELRTNRLGALAVAFVAAVLATVGAMLPTGLGASANLPEGFVDETVAEGFTRPTAVTQDKTGRIYVAAEPGEVWIVEGGLRATTPFLDIKPIVNGLGNRGILGFEVHPDFPDTPFVYVAYTYDPPEARTGTVEGGLDGEGQRVSRVVRYTSDAASDHQRVVDGSELILLGTNSTWENIGNPDARQTDTSTEACTVDGVVGGERIRDCVPAEGSSHTLGALEFGADGSLYIASGDAASFSGVDPRALRALDIDSLAGKLLRVDPVTGAGLPDNPFYDGDPLSNRSKVLNFGLRNPFQFTLDPTTDDPIIGDVGFGSWEEINLGGGQDFGWPCYEGERDGNAIQLSYASLAACVEYVADNNAKAPAYAWDRRGAGGAVLVGDVYEGTEWPERYRGRVFIGDFVEQRLEVLTIDAGAPVTVEPFATDIDWTDLVFGIDGHAYYTDVRSGRLGRLRFEIEPVPAPEPELAPAPIVAPDAVPEPVVAAVEPEPTQPEDVQPGKGTTEQGSIDVRITSPRDDAEESGQGVVILDSSDLELVHDSLNSRDDQTVGLRFVDLAIPSDATVTNAWVQFTADESGGDFSAVTIRGHLTPSAGPFSTDAFDLSGRPLTTNGVSWVPPAWDTVGASGPAERTDDISAVVQQIVAQQDWRPGNDLVLLMTGIGRRTAESYEGAPARGPVLHVDWTIAADQPAATNAISRRITAGVDDVEESEAGALFITSSDLELVSDPGRPGTQTVGLRWADLGIPAGSEITAAYLQFSVDEESSEPTTVSIRAEATGATAPFVHSPANVSGRALTSAEQRWQIRPWGPVGASGSDQRSPDLANIVQELVDGDTWTTSSDVVFVLSGTGRRVAQSSEKSLEDAPLLVLRWR